MADTIACNNCGTILYENPSGDPEKREPCPHCGSKARLFSVSGECRINFEARATATVISSINLMLQTVYVPGEKTDDGLLIAAVALPWFDIIESLKNDPTIAYKIPARMWEEIVAGAYKKAGFDEVTLTPRSGDHGRDVIAVKRGLFSGSNNE